MAEIYDARERSRAEIRRPRRSRGSALSRRPDRVALWAFAMAVTAMVLAATTAHAGSGGISATSGSGGDRYDRIWDRLSRRDHRWARRTGECESGNDPRAVSPDGRYRGAFQFTKPSWRAAPKSPGGDPIRYRWRVQAVVAVLLKHREGTKAWPVCG